MGLPVHRVPRLSQPGVQPLVLTHRSRSEPGGIWGGRDEAGVGKTQGHPPRTPAGGWGGSEEPCGGGGRAHGDLSGSGGPSSDSAWGEGQLLPGLWARGKGTPLGSFVAVWALLLKLLSL